MGTYAYRTYQERREIQKMYEKGATAKELADKFDVSVQTVYSELQRGYDGTRLPDMRKRYDADLAQRRMQQSFERRGRKRHHETAPANEGA